jgi:hypothetical protein
VGVRRTGTHNVNLRRVGSMIDGVLALPAALLPKRYWQSIDLPVPNVAPVSSVLTMLAGFAIGIRGYFGFLERLRHASGVSIMDISKAQIEGRLPETAAVSAIPAALAAMAPITFALFTPLGLFATYLVLTGLIRSAAAYIDEAHGDPILTGVDWLGRRMFTSRQERSVRTAREKLEGADEPDRRYDGAWAGLTGVDCVIVSARRKPGWDKGMWVTTDDGWFVLGEPFDRPMPNGLRTIYPLTAQTTLEAIRRSVPYQLPPLRPNVPKRRAEVETPKAPAES